MDDMVMLPTAGVKEEQTKIFVMPWLDASYAGKPLRAWYATMGAVVSTPTRLCRAIPEGASITKAWKFGIFTILVLLCFGHGPITLFQVVLQTRLGFEAALDLAGMSALFYIMKFVGVVAFLGLWGLVAHGILKISGPTTGTIGRTYQALLYSMASAFLFGIPAIGPYLLVPIAFLWWIISSSVMLCALQNVHGFRAFLASAVPPIMSILIVIAVFVFGITRMMSGIATARLSMMTGPTSTQAITLAITEYRTDYSVDGPPHAVGLVADGYLSNGNELMCMSTNTNWMVTVPGTSTGGAGPTYLTNLDPSMGMTVQQIQGVAAQAAATLPPNTIAHRLGDFVYTYHGISPSEPDGSLWVVIFYPDPNGNATPRIGEKLNMGLVDGSMITVDAGDLTAELSTQNASRATAGLPPLPDPSTITTSQPALDPG